MANPRPRTGPNDASLSLEPSMAYLKDPTNRDRRWERWPPSMAEFTLPDFVKLHFHPMSILKLHLGPLHKAPEFSKDSIIVHKF